MQKKSSILRLTESAIMIALAVVLSEIQIVNLPMGGSVTAFSMVPLFVIAYRHGTRWGLFTSFVYGLFQMMLGMHNLRYATSIWALLAIILFDYLVAFAVSGLGGIFRGKLHGNQPVELALGVLLPCVLRYACHFISGWAVWGVWAPEGMPAWLYSLSYNATYMIPETIVSFVGCALIALYLDFTSANITRRTRREVEEFERNNTAFAAKLCGIGVILIGVLSVVFDAVNVLLSEEEIELVAGDVLLKLGGAILLGVFFCAIGEAVQLLSRLVQKAEK